MITSKGVPLSRFAREGDDLPSYCAPIRVEELFAAVAALQHLCDEHNDPHWSPPPVWPMVLRAGWCAPAIHVVLRVRPFAAQETARAGEGGHTLRSALMVSGRKCTVLGQAPNDSGTTSTSEEPVSQEDEVFEFDDCICLAPQVLMPVPCADEYETNRWYSRKATTAALHGRNVCIVAHGAARSGKTSALFGHSSDGTPTGDGLAQHLARDLFASIGSDPGIRVTAALIADIDLRLVDLLSKDTNGRPSSYAEVHVRQPPRSRKVEAEATRVLVSDAEALMKFVEEAVSRCKACAAISWSILAECVHREHPFVLQLQITRSGDTVAKASTTSINFVDVACAAERPLRSPRSLHTFRLCMDSISNDDPRQHYVPVRGTSLTFLLSDCFTRRESLRIVVATVSPHAARLAKTVATLHAVRTWKHTSFV
jgi:hypothetical protein